VLKMNSTYARIFGVGPTGFGITLLFWTFAFKVAQIFPQFLISIPTPAKTILFLVFFVDAFYLIIVGSLYTRLSVRGIKLIKSGPYRYIRHPIYSGIIYSGSGLLALWFQSWIWVLFVIPISVCWSLLVEKEEELMITKFGNEYKKYMEVTGQFLPKLTTLKKLEEHAR